MSVIEVAFIAGPAVIVSTAVYIADRLSHPSGRHVITPQRSHAAPRDPFADPADRTDPDGEKYAATIRDTAAHAWKPDHQALAALVRGTGTARLPELPPGPPPDATGVLPPAEAWLGMPSEQYVDQLFAKYAEVTP